MNTVPDSLPKVDLKKIKWLREQKGVSQAWMSYQLGYETPLGYHYLEKGRCEILANQLPIISSLLGVRIEDLYTKSEKIIL